MGQNAGKLWTKDFTLVTVANFFIYLVFYLLVVTMAVYAVEEFGASESQAGLITGIFIIGTLIGRLFLGRLITDIGSKKFLYIGMFVFILTSCLYFIELNIGFLLFTRFLHGMGLGLVSTATGTIVAEIIPNHRKGEGISYFSMGITLSTAIGPFLGILMSQHISYQNIFAFCLLLGITSFVISLFVQVPNATIPVKNSREKEKLSLSSFIEPRAIPIASILLLVSLGYASVLSFINFYAMEIDLVDAASWFFVFYAISILVSRPFTGRIMDGKGEKFVMYPAFILFAVGLFLLSTAGNSFTLLLSGVLIGLGFGNMQSITQAIAVKSAPPERVGLATSTYYIFLDAGLGFGPYLLGFLIPFIGYQYLYMTMGILVVATLVIYYIQNKENSHVAIESRQRKVE